MHELGIYVDPQTRAWKNKGFARCARVFDLSRGSVKIVFVLALWALLWEVLVRVFEVRAFLLPPPSMILQEIARSYPYFLTNSFYTLGTSVIGFLIAIAVGVALGIGIVYSKFIETYVYTLLIALNSVPKVALAPLFVLWLGTGVYPKIAIAFSIALFSIVIDFVLGLRSVDPDAIALAKAARAKPLKVLSSIRIPHALPSLFAGMKVAVSFALIGAIVGEFVAGDAGLGHIILIAQSQFDTARAFAGLFLLAFIGTLLFYCVELLEKLLIPWHASQRSQKIGPKR
jgi:NitT/TauT family transport system permease protein